MTTGVLPRAETCFFERDLDMPLVRRSFATGNPYKNLIFRSSKARREGRALWRDRKGPWLGNEDLLPDIKINTDAMARTTQLVQQGFVKITE